MNYGGSLFLRICRWFLKLLVHEKDFIYLIGDVEEYYLIEKDRTGRISLYFRIVFQIIRSVPPLVIDKIRWGVHMFSSYFKTTFRNIGRRKSYAFINAAGLTAGITASLLILNFVSFEQSFDTFHEKSDRIYRLRFGSRSDSNAISGPLFQEKFSEVQKFAKFMSSDIRGVYSYGDVKIRQDQVFAANNQLFEIFSFNLVSGDPDSALVGKYNIVITETTAELYFGSVDALGAKLRFNDKFDFTVTGIIEDLPVNSHIQFDILVSFETMEDFHDQRVHESWTLVGIHTYLLLEQDADIASLEERFSTLAGELSEGPNVTEGALWEYFLMPLKDIHLKSHYEFELGDNSDFRTVNFLFFSSIMILLIAWSNYINLATSRSVERAREIGIRKVVGAYPKQLFFQFMSEAAILNIVAIACSVLITMFLLPVFGPFTGSPDRFVLWENHRFLIIAALFFAAGSFITGWYPASVLSSFNPNEVIKGIGAVAKGKMLRKGLVLFQFIVSAVLIAGSITMYRQVDFMINSSLGFDISDCLVVRRPAAVVNAFSPEYAEEMSRLRDDLLEIDGISLTARSSSVPGQYVWYMDHCRRTDEDSTNSYSLLFIAMSSEFPQLYELEVLAGRSFTSNFEQNQNVVLLNRSASETIGYETPEDAINEKILFFGRPFTIAGIVDDYHQESLKNSVQPLLFLFDPAVHGDISIKLEPDAGVEIVDKVRTVWEKYYPQSPFEYYFLESYFNNQYSPDTQVGKLTGLFAALAVGVAILGLIGLSSFNIVTRTKEIGIRQTLGASVPGIIKMLSREFVWLIIIANLIGLPLFYLYMDRWLDRYAFRIDPGWWFFILPVLLLIGISQTIIFIQVIRVARSNPVESLRYE